MLRDTQVTSEGVKKLEQTMPARKTRRDEPRFACLLLLIFLQESLKQN